MNVELYRCNDAPEKVKKKFENKLIIENIRFNADNMLAIRQPTIRFTPTNELSDWVDIMETGRYNYFRIPKFTRYYKITEMKTDNGQIIITGKSDALTSFQNDILNSTQYVVRSQSKRSKYLQDNKRPVRSDHKYYIKNFGRNVDDKGCNHVILVTTGKGGTVVNSD